jgi:putative ABC transport system permease protein
MNARPRRFFSRIVALFRSGRAEHELSREIDAHLRLLEDRFLAQGMSPGEARVAARRAFGGVEQVKEQQRDARTFRALAGWPLDLKLGMRMLARTPGLTIVAVIALSIAIGAGTAYLEAVNDIFRPSLRIAGAERVVGIHLQDLARGRPDPQLLRDFSAWRSSARTVEHLGAYTPIERNLITADGRSEPVKGVAISASAFRLASTPPLLGRPLLPGDERPAAQAVAVIGATLWKRRFEADPGIIGQPMQLGDTPYTIVGVMPDGFGFPVNHSLWVPLTDHGPGTTRGAGPLLRVFGRLAIGTDLEGAGAELNAISARIPDTGRQLRVTVLPYIDSLLAGSADDGMERTILYSGNIFFVGLLAICGATVATLVFARTATREGEITVRTALGASRARIVTQLFAEALVLTGVATAVGLFAASIGVRAVADYVRSQGSQLPFWWDDSLGLETVAYAGGLMLFAAAIIGVVPALKATGPRLQAGLKHAAGGSSMTFGRLWTGVIVAQVACTVIFLLSVVSLAWNATAGRHAGSQFAFAPGQFLAARLELDQDADAGRHEERFLTVYRDIERRLESDPAVAAVAYGTRLPGTSHEEFWVELDGMTSATMPDDGPLWVRSTGVSADFFAAFDQPVVSGRTFSTAEIANDLPVAIVDETFVRLIFGGRDPIGSRLRRQQESEERGPGPWLEIIGVVKDAAGKPAKITEDAVLYRPGAPGRGEPVQMVVRVRAAAQPLKPRVVAAAAAAGPAVRLHDVQSLEERYREDGMVHAMLAKALAVVGAVALLLATAGVYSLMSFTLARRTREIGIRTALGAAPGAIIRSIFSRAFGQVGLGVLLGGIPGGVLVAFGAPEVASGGGPMVAALASAAVAGLLLVITLCACVVPARRALRIEPTEALRAE